MELYICLLILSQISSIVMKKLLGFFILIVSISCKQTSNESAYTYFGGQIINPKVDYVYLIKDEKVIDSTLLDKDHKFLMKFDIKKEGLFHFKHGNEFQYLYLEPNDSVLVRLNTWDFDESIIFSGKGAEKNNFLINLYLINELEDKNFFPNYQFDADIFSKKIDSAIKSKEKLLTDFKKTTNNFSAGFINVAKTGLILTSLRKKENYAYGHKMLLNLSNYPVVGENFYNHRKNINLNDTSLIYFHPYQNYLHSLIYNKASQLKEKDTSQQSFSLIALKLIEEQTKSEKIKNLLLKQILLESFLRKSPCRFDENELQFYVDNCANTVDKNRIKKLVSDSNSLTNESSLTDFEVIDNKNKIIAIKKLIQNKKTVLYFWSPTTMSSEYLTSRIQYLELNFPNILFIGINMDSSKPSIENTLKSPLKNQYFLPENSLGRNHVSSLFPRTLLINKNGTVVNSFTFLASKHFNQQLSELEKR